jgi:hypothetical protein
MPHALIHYFRIPLLITNGIRHDGLREFHLISTGKKQNRFHPQENPLRLF